LGRTPALGWTNAPHFQIYQIQRGFGQLLTEAVKIQPNFFLQ